MARVIAGMAMSLDEFVADRNGEVGRLSPDMEAMRKTEQLQEAMRSTGSVVMGRRFYAMGDGDVTDYGFQVQIFVLTPQAPVPVAKGENDKLTSSIVTEGIERAIEHAKACAGS